MFNKYVPRKDIKDVAATEISQWEASMFFFSGEQVSLINKWSPEINNNISTTVACPVSTGENNLNI